MYDGVTQEDFLGGGLRFNTPAKVALRSPLESVILVQ